jgi:hypothetical protein
MKKIEDKTADAWLDDLMKDSLLESPSPDFTSKVMLRVQDTKTESATIYKPLLSKSFWIILLLCFTGLFVFLINNESIASKSRFKFLDFSFGFSATFEFSRITIYAVVFSTLFFLIQISLLNKYFTKQIENQKYD